MRSLFKVLTLAATVFFLSFSQVLAYSLEDFKADLDFLSTVTEGKLLFNPFGTNPDPNFAKHRLSDEQIQFLCDSDCSSKNIGVNFGTIYKGGDYNKARTLKMNWSLEIARAGSAQSVADVINDEGVANVIIRIGVGGDSLGFNNPSDYVAFLNDVAGRVGGKPFYAIAGPNEPDIEKWAAPNCSPPDQGAAPAVRALFYNCVGPILADYMNKVIAGAPSNVRLLSPAFNMTSFMFNDDTGRPDGIPLAMRRAGANFAGLYAIAGNLYPAGDSMQNIWNNHVASVVNQLGRPVVITETAPWNPLNELFSGFDTSIYNDYNTTDDQFYLHPILGIDRQLPADAGPYNANLKLIRDDLINQGYEAYCATPGFRIELTQAGKDWMADYVEQNPPGAVFGGENNVFIRNPGIGDLVRSWLTVDYREVDTPVFRDIEDKQHLMASLDEYFGFKDTVLGENPQSELTSAAINSLLSNQQRCEASVRILIRQEEMCNKLALPDACALYARPVPETSFTIKTMLDSYKSLAAEAVTRLPDANIQGYQNKDTIKAVCTEVLTTDWNLVAREGLLYTPLTIDRAYRLAFLITTIELNNPRYTTMFNLFTHPNGGAVGGPPSPDHAILVNAFKIPDILTTTQLEQESLIASGNTPWTDSSKLTRNSLLTEKMQEEIETTVDEKKIDLIQAANYYDTNSQTHSDEIECMKGASNRGVGGPECKDELAKALVDIINTQTSNRVSPENQIDPTCQELVKEPANEILDYGSFGTVDSITNPPAHLTYTTEFGAQLLNRIFNVPDEDVAETGDLDTTHQIEPRGKSHPSFAETWKPGDPLADNPIAGMPRDWGLKSLFHVVTDTYPDFPYAGCCDEREVKHFLVYPMGYDINTVQEVLASTFFNSEQKDELASLSEDFDRIQITGDEIEFTGGTREYTFEDYVKGEPVGYKQNWPPGVDFIGINDPARYAVDEIDRCRKVYGPSSEIEYIDPITFEPVYKPIQIGWELPCDRSFGWNILQKGHELSAGLVGGKLGFYLQNVQKSLNSRYSAVRDYLDTCTTTEQFLTGRCGETVEPVAEANPILCTDASCTQSAPSIPDDPGELPPPSPGCVNSACFTMCAQRNTSGTLTINFTWTGSAGCACGDLSDHEILINGVSQGRPSCINVISQTVPSRSCTYDSQPLGVVVCRKKGNYYCEPSSCDACRMQNEEQMCVIATEI